MYTRLFGTYARVLTPITIYYEHLKISTSWNIFIIWSNPLAPIHPEIFLPVEISNQPVGITNQLVENWLDQPIPMGCKPKTTSWNSFTMVKSIGSHIHPEISLLVEINHLLVDQLNPMGYIFCTDHPPLNPIS